MELISSADEAPDIESAIHYLYRNHKHTDFQLISQDGSDRYDVHKLIIAVRSHVLSQVLKGCPSLKDYRIENVSKLALQNMIRYFYGESVVLEKISDVNETKAIAEKFGVVGLFQICENKLDDIEVNVCNVLSVIQTAADFNNEMKQNECLRLIGECQETVFQNQEFNRMQFEKVLKIFVKLKSMQLMTEASFLRAAIRWLETNESIKSKKIVMEYVDVCSISMDDFLDIIVSHPNFFEKTEISAIVGEIRSREKIKIELEAQQNVNAITARRLNIGTNTDNESEESIVMTNTASATVVRNCCSNKPKRLTIRILPDVDGKNVYVVKERAQITIQERYSTRTFRIRIDEVLKRGLLGNIMTEKKSSFTYSDVDISYEGIYFMLGNRKELDENLTPVQYIEVQKAALFFQLYELSEKCLKKISGIIDYDPLFLDGLRKLINFRKKWLSILLNKPLSVILHPNFIESSADLIILLLQQDELNVKSEVQLLLAVISWLEVHNRQRWHFRDRVLEKLAFENISFADFKYTVLHHPNFFTPEEKRCILLYKNAAGEKIEFYKENLPSWYNFKSRKIAKSDIFVFYLENVILESDDRSRLFTCK